jgi:hypothetical protein
MGYQCLKISALFYGFPSDLRAMTYQELPGGIADLAERSLVISRKKQRDSIRNPALNLTQRRQGQRRTKKLTG